MSFGTGFSNSSLAISLDSNIGKPDYASTVTSTLSAPTSSSVKKSRRFSGFDYYRRKLFSGGSSQLSSGMTQDGRGEFILATFFSFLSLLLKKN